MTDTVLTLQAIDDLTSDNTSGLITPQILRDAFETILTQHAQISDAGNAQETSIDDTSNWFELVSNNPSISEVSSFGGGPNFDKPLNARLRFLGALPRMHHIAVSISFTSVANNQEVHIRLGKNGIVSPQSEIRRSVSTGSDVGTSALHWITTLNQNDYLAVHVKNITGANNVTFISYNIQAIGMPM